MKFLKLTIWALLVSLSFQNCTKKEDKGEDSADGQASGREIWTRAEARAWYTKQGWLVGADFLPSTAINQLEMFQEASFNTATINKELGWAQNIAMNTMRVYLHDLLNERPLNSGLMNDDVQQSFRLP